MKGGGRNSDMKLLLWMVGGAVLLILIVSFLVPKHENNDPRPRTDNNGSAGAKAAFLLLPKLGYKVGVWNSPEDGLEKVDASKTTLVLAATYVEPKLVKPTAAAVKRFLERGGRVLATSDAALLPNGRTGAATVAHSSLCYTTPEGQSVLAQAGQVSTRDEGAWDERESKLGPALHVEQRCGDDAVVVSYPVGKGEVIWWSSSLPLSNSGLHEDASLRLLLASVGEPGRTVLFDEFVHGEQHGFWDAAKGLPLWWLFWQFVLIAVLLVLSFSRRKGPLRMPVTVPRTSPVEFATSMGHLYERAGATSAATGMARRRLLRFLQAECGVARVTIDEGAAAIAEALRERFGGDWSALREHLADAAEADNTELAPKSALRLVQALDEDSERLHRILAPKRAVAARKTISKEDSEVRNAELVSATKE
jgi:hypothetical protein